MIVDLFAGPGGWDLGARALGLEPLGVELDDDACATRTAYGLATLQGDVSALDPVVVAGGAVGLIASPPCTAFSMAGHGAGRDAVSVYEEAVRRFTTDDPMTDAALDAACGDPTAHLVLEPLRWALALRPEWCAFEQVPPVLPIWKAIAQELQLHGYSTWTGLVSSEQYGVPQTRKRAILLASRVRTVKPPVPTHQQYVPPRVKPAQEESLFDVPDAERIVVPGEAGLLPWVSMAEALGWDPADQVGFPRRNDLDDGGEYRERDLRDASEPAFALTEKARSSVRMSAGKRENQAVRSIDEPAPTIVGGHDTNNRVWVVETIDAEPAPTIAGESRNDQLVHERPATTLAGDPRVPQPGHKKDKDNMDSPRRMEGSVRVSIEEAAVLQSFPRSYPWQGSKTSKFKQIGNAVPPKLAEALLRAVVGS